MIAQHIRAFVTKNICLDFIRISSHKPRSSSSVTSGGSCESLLPRFSHPMTAEYTQMPSQRSAESWLDSVPTSPAGRLRCSEGFHFRQNSLHCLFMPLGFGGPDLPYYHSESKGVLSNINYVVHVTRLQESQLCVQPSLGDSHLKEIEISW